MGRKCVSHFELLGLGSDSFFPFFPFIEMGVPESTFLIYSRLKRPTLEKHFQLQISHSRALVAAVVVPGLPPLFLVTKAACFKATEPTFASSTRGTVNFLGHPNVLTIHHKASLLTESNAFVRSTKTGIL